MKLEELRGKDTFEARAVLEALTVKKLKEICKEHHRRGYSRFRKYQLVNELMMACCDEYLLSDLNGAKRESTDTPTENQSKTQEESTMTKMTTKQAIEAVSELTTTAEIALVLVQCTKAGICEVFTAITGEKAYPQSCTKGDLAERSARRIAAWKEESKFLAMEVMEKVGYLSFGTDLSLSAPVEKCSLYELIVIVQELGVSYDEYKTNIEKICGKTCVPVSSKVLAYYLSAQLSQLIKKNVEYRWLHGGKVQPVTYDPRTATIAESIEYGRTLIPQTEYAQKQYELGAQMMRNFLLGAATFEEITDWKAHTRSFLRGMCAHLGVPEITHEDYSDAMKELAMHDVITGTVDNIMSGKRQISDYLTEEEQSQDAEYLAGNPELVLEESGKGQTESTKENAVGIEDYMRSLWGTGLNAETMLALSSCEILYKQITSTPEPHAFRPQDEAQLRVMIGFKCRYNDRGLESGMSIKVNLNTVEVSDTELAGKCFAEYVRRKFAREYERAKKIHEADKHSPRAQTITHEGTSLIDICAGVENYECGKLTKGELAEILTQAPAEALRKYILDVIASETGYELMRTA